MKAFISWSGGKESSLSFHKVSKDFEISYLLNMLSEDGKRSRSHGVRSDLLKLQSEAIGIPIIQRKTSWENYEEEFKKAVLDMKKENTEAGVFGDIDIQEHRDWVERVCKETGIKPILPLWKEKREKLLNEFIDAGFKAIVVGTQADFKELLGRKIDEKFLEELKTLKEIDLCGERGEYHTFVFDGPIFRKSVKILTDEKVFKDGYWFLKVIPRKELSIED